MTPSTPKAHVLLASDTPIAMVFYRKSHLTTYCLQLDYGRRGKGSPERLTKGSRFYGRLFPHRSHLSPDGSLLIYFAMRGRKTGESSDPSTWTAVCSPPWLKAHLFYPNGSTWGGGGMFLEGRRLVVFETVPEGAGPEYSKFRGYQIIRDTKILPADEMSLLTERYKTPAETRIPCPLGSDEKQRPVIVRTKKPHSPDNYNYFDYILQDASGKDIAGAEEIVLANWAGWDIYGRLMVASGSKLEIFEVNHGKSLGKPARTLDLEAAIA
jgi:hypothetical protein